MAENLIHGITTCGIPILGSHTAISPAGHAVVLIHGPRQCGKSALARSLGNALGYRYISLDDGNQLQAAKADPVGFIQSHPGKATLDEVQRAPELFTSIKANVDQNRQPGRLILTGSANVLLLPGWPTPWPGVWKSCDCAPWPAVNRR